MKKIFLFIFLFNVILSFSANASVESDTSNPWEDQSGLVFVAETSSMCTTKTEILTVLVFFFLSFVFVIYFLLFIIELVLYKKRRDDYFLKIIKLSSYIYSALIIFAYFLVALYYFFIDDEKCGNNCIWSDLLIFLIPSLLFLFVGFIVGNKIKKLRKGEVKQNNK